MGWTHPMCDGCWAEQKGIWIPPPQATKSLGEQLDLALDGDSAAMKAFTLAAAMERWPNDDLKLLAVREPHRVMGTVAELCCFCGAQTSSGIYVRHDPGLLGCAHD